MLFNNTVNYEQAIHFICSSCSESVPSHKNLLIVLQIYIVEKTGHFNLFYESSEAADHSCIIDVLNSVLLNLLVRPVLNCYCRIHTHAMAKSFRQIHITYILATAAKFA